MTAYMEVDEKVPKCEYMYMYFLDNEQKYKIMLNASDLSNIRRLN